MRTIRLLEEVPFRQLINQLESQQGIEGLEELVLMICERLTVEENLDVINIIKKINKAKIIEKIDNFQRTYNQRGEDDAS